MRVIQFNESFPPVMDGVANVTRNYAYWIKKKYGKSYVVTPEYPGYVDDEIYPVLRYPSIPMALRKPYRIGIGAHNHKLWKKLNSLEIDIVHAQSPFSSGNIALQYARQKNVPIVATFHSKFYDDFKEVTRSDVISWMITHLIVDFFNYADAVWAINESTKKTLISYGYKGDIDVVPNGTDFTEPDDPEALRTSVEKKYKIKKDTLLFLFVGQIIQQKNIATTLKALKLLQDANIDFTMFFVGEGRGREHFQDMVKKLRLSDQVRFTGKIMDRDELKGLFTRADLFVFPSVYDTGGIVTREAAAVETPSVVVKGSNASEDMEDGKNGFLCDNSPEGLANTVKRIIKDPQQLKKVGEEARKTLYHSWEEIIDDHVIPRYRSVIRAYNNDEEED
ncbi:MAG: glycosyltransferase [Candidatus Marinimicrobia bacterium]|nr:glycosyltransferase [Candidatus Neomarinimicrobiota bacterium]